MRTRRPLLIAGAATTAVLLSLSSAAPALAASEVVVTDRETVQVYMTPTGKVKVARVYDQITATGQGTVDIENPVSTDGLRNLEGLSGVDVEDGKAVTEITVDGEKRLRTVSEFDGELPVTIKPTFELDGDVYKDPEDLVGKSGDLKVTYRVENITGEPTTLTVKDGQGRDVERTVDVPMPLVGSLVTVLPKGYYSVASDQATISGDGRGGTRMTFTMTLLPPVGSAVAEFGYTARVEDVIIPRATVSIAVVQPLKNPSLSTAAASYQGGADTGAALTAGADEIDSNLLRLRDGAGELLSGLIQLRDGAEQLNDGLAGEAAPGANRLADGAGEAAAGAGRLADGLKDAESGSGELADGVGQIADGNQQLADGFNSPTGAQDLVTGSQDLAAGLGLISGGLATLAGVEGLPQAYSTTLALKAGVDKIIAGLGSASQSGTILNGLAQLSAGNAQLQAGMALVQAGVDQVASGLPTAKGGVDLIQAGLDAALASGGDIDQLSGGVSAARALLNNVTCDPAAQPGCGTALATAKGTLDAVLAGIEGLDGLRDQTEAASAGLGQVSTGLGTAITGLGTATTPGTIRFGIDQVIKGLAASATGLSQVTAGVNAVKLGLTNPNCNTAKPTDPANPCGIREGLTLLSNGLLAAVGGVTQLSAGAKKAATGSGDLADGIAEAGDGAEQLADGSQEASVGSRKLADGLATASSGSGELADGNRQIADGAGELAAGLDEAAAGSGLLADGLGEAADGAPQIVDGATRLSNEGTKLLVEAGNDTALEFGTNFAIIEAMADKTADGGLPYGAPDGATGSAAYSFELAAASNEGSEERDPRAARDRRPRRRGPAVHSDPGPLLLGPSRRKAGHPPGWPATGAMSPNAEWCRAFPRKRVSPCGRRRSPCPGRSLRAAGSTRPRCASSPAATPARPDRPGAARRPRPRVPGRR